MLNKIKSILPWKLALLLTVAAISFYFVSKKIAVLVITHTSMYTAVVKEGYMDKEYRDKMFREFYDSYRRKMTSRN